MCIRYTITANAEELKSRFKVRVPTSFQSRYNAAPSQVLPVITNENPEDFSFFHWGLISNLAKNKSISSKLINTMAEVLDEKVGLKNAVKFRRCLVPADGYYEWKTLGKKTKVPYRVTLNNNGVFTFAGLWEEFEDNNGEMFHAFTIVTTQANTAVRQVSDRMPVILPKNKEQLWLDNSLTTEEHRQLLVPFDASKMNLYSVAPLVNDTNLDHPGLIRQAPSADQFGNYTLFG